MSRASRLSVGLLFAASAVAWAGPPRIASVKVGAERVLIPPGGGLAYFPDQPLAVISENPLTFLMTAGESTVLMTGRDWASAGPVQKVLEPAGGTGPDNAYAGCGAIYELPAGGYHGFYHAEDHAGYQKMANGVKNFRASVCLAKVPADRSRVDRAGPVVTGHAPKDTASRQPQGAADPSVVTSADGQHLLMWYTDHARDGGRGVQIALARSPIAEAGKPGSWRKWHAGGFGEPGLGGRETPVLSMRTALPGGADAWAPHVTVLPPSTPGGARYLMVFNATSYADFDAGGAADAEPGGGRRPAVGGIFAAASRDGVTWGEPVRLAAAAAVPIPGRRIAIHPTFRLKAARGGAVRGLLLYGGSDAWGGGPGQTPHHLRGRPVTLELTGG